MTRVPALLLPALLLADLAPAVPRLECPHGYVHDMGQGIVARRKVWMTEENEVTAAAELLTDCASGRTLSVTLAPFDVEGDESTTHDLVREALATGAAVTLDDLRVPLERFVGDTAFDLSVSPGLQTCGCARFYPDLRGDKLPWTEGPAE